MKIVDNIVGRVLAAQAARKERRLEQYAADAYAAVITPNQKPQYSRSR